MPTKLFSRQSRAAREGGRDLPAQPLGSEHHPGLDPQAGAVSTPPGLSGASLRLEVDPESYWLYTSSPLDARKRAEAVERYGLEGALEQLGLNGGKA